MGTTRDHLRNDAQLQIAYSIQIEGYKYILTDGSPSACVTAYAATNWSDALGGLAVTSTFQQSFEPWSNELPVNHLTFTVMPDNTASGEPDQFGIDVFKTKPTAKTELTVAFASDADGGSGFNLTVQKADSFSTGQVFIGNQAMNVTSAPSGTTIAVAANGQGYFSPFSTGPGASNTFPGPASLAPNINVNDYQVAAPTYVTDIPTSWIGRKVGVYVHRVVNGVLDVLAQAELVFAGTIDRVSDLGSKGTQIDCVSIQRQILDSVVMDRQWKATLEPGMNFTAGMEYRVQLKHYPVTAGSLGNGTLAQHRLVCVSGTPADDHEFQAGRYTAEQIASLIGTHAQESDQIGKDAGSGKGAAYVHEWSSFITENNRYRLAARDDSGGAMIKIRLEATHTTMLDLLGFNVGSSKPEGKWRHTDWSPQVDSDEDGGAIIESGESPLQYMPIHRLSGEHEGFFAELELQGSTGSFYDHTSELPPEAAQISQLGGTWSYFMLNDDLVFLAKYVSDTSLTYCSTGVGISKLGKKNQTEIYAGARVGEKPPVVKQIFYSSDTFTNQVTKLLATIDGQGSNHATYDTLACGGAGIPWSLLGTNWVNSCLDLEQSAVEDSLVLLIDKPTRVWDLIESDFMVRMAQIVWKDGGLQCAQLQTPSAETADITLDETTRIDIRETTSEQFDSWLCNTLKLKYNRDPVDDKYRNESIVRDAVGFELLGGLAKTKTIELRNTYAANVNSGASIESLGEMLTARFMPVLSRPLRVFKVSVNHKFWHVTPGMTVSFSSDMVRDPTTGKRGVTSRACTVIDIAFQYGVSSDGQSYTGEVTLLYTEEERGFTMGWACEHNYDYAGGSFANGVWDDTGTSGYYYVAVEQQEYTTGTDIDTDYVAVGDCVRVTEVDPADPASADSFSDTVGDIMSSPTNAIGLDNGFGAGGRPAFSSSKRYRITPDKYSVVAAGGNAATQILDCFMADSGDGLIQDTIEPNTYTDNRVIDGFTVASATNLPVRHANNSYDEGASFHPGLMRDLCRMANNLTNYKCAPHMPSIPCGYGVNYDDGTRSTSNGSSTIGEILDFFPFYVGSGGFLGGRTRKLNVQPIMGYNGTGTATIYVVTSERPPTPTLFSAGSLIYDPVFAGVSKTLTFTSTQDIGTAPGYTWAYPSAQQVTPVPMVGDYDFTWITVYSSTGSNHAYCGFSQLWLGPYE